MFSAKLRENYPKMGNKKEFFPFMGNVSQKWEVLPIKWEEGRKPQGDWA
jgi:hypothetical protein